MALAHSSLWAQGTLTPPVGPIAPVMRSLDQIEPRLPLQSGVAGVQIRTGGEIVITNSGSYYLTRNLTTSDPTYHCIEIGSSAMNVTLDLNGFTVSRTNGGSFTYGIYIPAVPGQQVAIRNGFIVGGGTNAGIAAAIYTLSSTEGNVQVDNVHVRQVRSGLRLNRGEARSAVRNSSVEGSGLYGIVADVVEGCIVRESVNYGINASIVRDCYVRQTVGTGDAIYAEPGPSTVINSVGDSNGGIGIIGNSVINCTARTFGPTNTPALKAKVASNCFAEHSGGRVIEASIAIGCHTGSGTNVITNKYNMP